MSFFKDDFYTSKVSRRIRWNRTGQRGFSPWENKGLIGIILASAITGAVLAVLILPLIVGRGYFGPGDEKVNAVTAFVNQAQTDESNSVVRAVTAVKPAVVSVVSSVKDGDQSQEVGLGSGVIFREKWE